MKLCCRVLIFEGIKGFATSFLNLLWCGFFPDAFGAMVVAARPRSSAAQSHRRKGGKAYIFSLPPHLPRDIELTSDAKHAIIPIETYRDMKGVK